MLEATRGWSWDPYEEAWQKMFRSLLNYIEENRTLTDARNNFNIVPIDYVDDEGDKPYKWLKLITLTMATMLIIYTLIWVFGK